MVHAALAVWGVSTALVVAVLLVCLTWFGWAHSFDSAIYVRSLWGLAHGDAMNPLVGIHALSVHFNLILLPLAPLTRLVEPASVLVALQAVAFGATVWFTARATVRAALREGADAAAMWGVAACTAVLTVGTPSVGNPFLFDLRPDLLGVPLITAGLLRAREQGNHDSVSAAWMLSSLLVREEWAAVVAASILLTPLSWEAIRSTWKLRLGVAVVASVWLLGYWYGVRVWMGDGSFAMSQQVTADFGDATAPLTLAQQAGYKAELLAAVFLGMGGLALGGWRWWPALIPGLAFTLMQSRMQELVLNFHYIMFCAPGVIVAGVEGFHRLFRAGYTNVPRVFYAWITVVAIGVALYTASSAFPGGGRFRSENFLLLLEDADAVAEAERLGAMHALAGNIDDGGSAILPFGIAARWADRSNMRIMEAVEADLAAGEPFPADVQWVVLPRRLWRTVGASLVQQQRFHLVDWVDRRAALLTAAPVEPPSGHLADAYGTAPCEDPAGVWPQARLELCVLQPQPDGRMAVWVRAMSGARPLEGLMLVARPVGASPQEGIPLWIHEGLIDLSHVRGAPVPAVTLGPLPAGPVEFELRTAAEVLPLHQLDGTVVMQYRP